MKLEKVFGVATKVNEASYIDRAMLDGKITRLLENDRHIALKGASKTGKSWLRQKCMGDVNVVQCRLGKKVQDIYVEALSNLGVKLALETAETNNIKGIIEASGEMGASLLYKVAVKLGIAAEISDSTKYRDLKCDLNNLRFIADLIIASGKRLVIEDFHYLSVENRKQFAYDLKTLWDYGCYVIIIGVWTQSNLLTYLNPDLTGRIEEVSILWREEDLKKVLQKGCHNLDIKITESIMDNLIKDSFGNVGILQTLVYNLCEEESIYETVSIRTVISNTESFKKAAQRYADQLDGVYQRYIQILSEGIYSRGDSTGIYAYTMKAIVGADDLLLMNGFSRDAIFSITNSWEPRIQLGNLQKILIKLEDLQCDSENKGLVISYDQSTDSVFVVDRQLLFYRKHHTMKWPWEAILDELRNKNKVKNRKLQK